MTRSKRQRFRPTLDLLDQRCLLASSGLTPAQIANAYGLAGLAFGSTPANGAGQTIALIETGNDPNIQTELSTFDANFNLPAPPSLKIVGETGTTALPPTGFGGSQEEALDVEWAHALAPGANLLVVEANSSSTSDLMAAVQTAAATPGVSVVSMSWGGAETDNETSYDSDFTTAGVTFVAASGDDGQFAGAEYPAASPYVVGVGGTTLSVDSSGDYLGETPWYSTSGGPSQVEAEPPYQQGVQTSGARSTPDVAFDGDPTTGVQVYAMNPFGNYGSWQTVAGTSLGAPAWSAIFAIADQGRALAGAAPLGSLQTLTTLYSLPSTDFHVIDGGYNSYTGLGTPNGDALIEGLVNTNAPATTTLPPSSTPTPTPSSTTPTPTAPIEFVPPYFGFGTPVSTNPIVITVITPTKAHKHKKAATHPKTTHKAVAPKVHHTKPALAVLQESKHDLVEK